MKEPRRRTSGNSVSLASGLLLIPLLVMLGGALVQSSGAIADEPTEITSELRLPNRFIKISDRVISGAQPEKEKHYASLAALGVRTIASVDGAIPDVETAKRFGLRYVHIPIGYDGVSPQACVDLAAVISRTRGSVFVHCHHGRHRGPAAAVIAAMSTGQIDTAQAIKVLEQAETDRQYQGLWRDVANYKRPSKQVSTSSLVEKAEVGLLARSMSQLTRSLEAFDELRRLHRNANEESRKVATSQIAVLIEEGFRESMRAPEVIANTEMACQMSDTQTLAHELRIAAESRDWTVVDRKLQNLKEACTTCHKAHRN